MLKKKIYEKTQATVVEQNKLIDEGNELTTSYRKSKAELVKIKKDNSADMKRLAQEYKDAQALPDADEKKTKMEKAQEDNDKLVNENAQHTHDINELDKLLSDLDNKKQQIERDQKVTGKENRDQYALI